MPARHAKPDAFADAVPHADAHADRNAHAHADRNAHADRDAHAHADRHDNAHSDAPAGRQHGHESRQRHGRADAVAVAGLERQPRFDHSGHRPRVRDVGRRDGHEHRGGDAALSVADASPNVPGHLVNGAFSLGQNLQARATNTASPSMAFAPISANPLTLLTYPGPIGNDLVTIGLKQPVGANEGLRTGLYSKTLTFTLSTTTR